MHAGERVNALTHGVGSLLALIGSGALVAAAARSGDPWKIVGVSVYSTSCDRPERLRQPGRPRPAICQELLRQLGVL